MAFRRTRWLVYALFAFFAEQIIVNGAHLMGILVLIAALIATGEKWGRAVQA